MSEKLKIAFVCPTIGFVILLAFMYLTGRPKSIPNCQKLAEIAATKINVELQTISDVKEPTKNLLICLEEQDYSSRNFQELQKLLTILQSTSPNQVLEGKLKDSYQQNINEIAFLYNPLSFYGVFDRFTASVFSLLLISIYLPLVLFFGQAFVDPSILSRLED